MKKILVVDDTTDLMELLVCIMEIAGHEAVGITNGLKAMEIAGQFRPDLILLDVMLGNCDGRDICNALKANSSFSGIPVIMISASHGIRSLVEKQCTPDVFMSKPFNTDELIMRVNTLLGIAC